ncbi:MotA/TolQ/ExbB proton channel family protein [candidate division CSSED10-310 bacterium]|uniref:MotA/TolQ/ExbB proton channel family protein n=1 Tax=candidate division CSSED10-310 bacterium TaxID=2855610 RepID=A0ABV6YR23_UNCC1
MFENVMILDYFNKGGTIMYPLLILSILSFTFIIERLWFYLRISRDNAHFLPRIQPALKRRKIKEAITICNNFKGPVALTVKAGLLKYNEGQAQAEKAIERTATHQLTRLESGLGILSSIGNIAPLLGFLGTVIGMIKSFDVIAYQGLDDPSLVAIGIKEALITTATGLIVAIPTLAAFNYFTSRVSHFVFEMEINSEEMLDLLFEDERELHFEDD